MSSVLPKRDRVPARWTFRTVLKDLFTEPLVPGKRQLLSGGRRG
ncbi:hypothetical protein [Arthrobacter woluwensis]|nr:hypothetical protein [Arthrobacter woluwensis]